MSEAKSNVAEFSVSEISFSIKKTMEDTFGYVRVRGELGRISRPGSGHIYLDLKDDRAVLSGVIWRGVASKLKIQPEQGLEVIATGKITTFPGQSKYQMVIDALEPAGAGALMALLEERKKKLTAEGLFASGRKKSLPGLPRVIGVVTSPTGAVIRDILHRISDRFPLHMLVWPVRVQGETSGAEVANGIRGFNALPQDGPIARPDLLIVARGGGSIEDLWGFNEEAVVRAAADSDIPLISAVGHETDWTLIDLAADVRAPTPTGAAEIAVPVKADLMGMTDDLSRRLLSGLNRLVSNRRTELRAAGAALPALRDLLALPQQRFDTAANGLERGLIVNTRHHRTAYQNAAARHAPYLLTRMTRQAKERLLQEADRQNRALRTTISQKRQGLDAVAARLTPSRLSQQMLVNTERLGGLSDRLVRALDGRISRERDRLQAVGGLLQSLSYKDVLARGYAVVRDDKGQPIQSTEDVSSGMALSIEVSDGSFGAVAAGIPPGKSHPKSKTKKATSQPSKPEGQGSLF
ncbi:exodeoxyribonuclease VII large subunit [Roseibium hamelinense]|uniref:Exodeoxyribonuclease 7 large subunit n=1 Tax=Roseibium hamelinense TaxID=150831 RepID=A0A562T1T3_9HYPH|nr:exodeoxyribonuclease VII large subunit [Roseibium hamelinense]MTI43333.1 exodeoxyribonuclease VII large subunit [Roseibium hamelinense]TWI87532.1 exodeoxyribonuclease VII large subunit [Roseibium hamelinense]